tara:strand:- start:654 stop:842 length:189 start_codon:yes stop_codon:yes gene_type:complete
MAKYKKISESSKQSLLDKLFYYLGRGMKPTIVKKMSKKDPKFAKAWDRLSKHRDYMDDLFDN